MSALISWIVASHAPEVLAAVLGPSLTLAEALGDEIVLVRNADSIATAYRTGQDRARHPVRAFVHHDVRILALQSLRHALLTHCRKANGVVGVIGSRTPALPWWEGDRVGSVRDARLGLLKFTAGGEPAAVLDGLLLGSCHDLAWDDTYPGWHLYDHDIARQQTEAGRTNWCLADGASLVEHVTTGPTNTERLVGWAEGVARYRDKWEHA